MQHPAAAGSATAPVRAWLRVEGLVVFALAAFLYARGGHSWGLFALLFFLPDVSFAAYLAGPRYGAIAYNVLHSHIGPGVLAMAMLAGGRTAVIPLIWAAHIGFDRMLGYGLKYPTGFGDTHLGAVGRPRG